MCGIVGYLGYQEAYPILINGLKHLEYRGYDSAGVALIDCTGKLNVYKSKGKVSDLEVFVQTKSSEGNIGIAHTRWATHGEPNQINAHPHYSSSENLALIHNGIIENYAVLKEMLIHNGYEFKSSPLVIGVGNGEYFIASDATPIIEYTSSVIYLNDKEMAILYRKEGLKIVILDNEELLPVVVKLDLTLSQLEKGG